MSQITHETVKKLINAHYSETIDIPADVIYQEMRNTIINCINSLKYAYDLAYLEGKLRCSDYHEAKRALPQLGVQYGYLHSVVRREGGTNTFRFSYRRPTATGSIHRIGMRLSRGTYGRCLQKFATSQTEYIIASDLERDYVRLRHTGRQIKKALRTLTSTGFCN